MSKDTNLSGKFRTNYDKENYTFDLLNNIYIRLFSVDEMMEKLRKHGFEENQEVEDDKRTDKQ